jgi:competence protein ComEC
MGGSVRVASPSLLALGLEALLIMMIWWRPLSARKRVVFAAVTVVMVAASLFTRRPENVLRTTFLEVGDADACLVEFPSGETMLIDTGFASPGLDCGEDLIAPFLWKRGITAIDTLVLSHPDADHTGGAAYLIENFRIGRLWAPETGGTPPGFEDVFTAINERECVSRRLARYPMPPVATCPTTISRWYFA